MDDFELIDAILKSCQTEGTVTPATTCLNEEADGRADALPQPDGMSAAVAHEMPDCLKDPMFHWARATYGEIVAAKYYRETHPFNRETASAFEISQEEARLAKTAQEEKRRGVTPSRHKDLRPWLERPCSLYSNAFTVHKSETIQFRDLMETIRTGKDLHYPHFSTEQVEKIRSLQSLLIKAEERVAAAEAGGDHAQIEEARAEAACLDNEKREMKTQLPMACSAGVFHIRNAGGLSEPSYVIGGDLDHIPPQLMEETRAKLRGWKHAGMVAGSPSGHGIKLLAVYDPAGERYTPSMHLRAFQALKAAIEELGLGQFFDDVVKDISRGMFLTVDKEVYVNANPEPLQLPPEVPPEDPPPPRKMEKKVPKTNSAPPERKAEDSNPPAIAGPQRDPSALSDEDEAAVLRDALQYVSADCDYKRWRNNAFGIHRRFPTEQGFQIFDTWSSSSKAKAGETGHYDPVAARKLWDSIRSDYKGRAVTLATIYAAAKNNGWNRKSTVSAVRKEKMSPPAEHELPRCYKMRGDQVFYIDTGAGVYVPMSEKHLMGKLRAMVPYFDLCELERVSLKERTLLDQFVNRIATDPEHMIDSVIALAGRPRGVLEENGARILNTFVDRMPEGRQGDYETWKAVIRTRFASTKEGDLQASLLLRHLGRMIRCYKAGRGEACRALGLVGGTDNGKTLLIKMMAWVLGQDDAGKAHEWMSRLEKYNANLVRYGVWASDDTYTLPREEDRAKVAEAIREVTASGGVRWRGMYVEGERCTSFKALVIATNDEPEERIRSLPPIGPDLRDKVLILYLEPQQGEYQLPDGTVFKMPGEDREARLALENKLKSEVPGLIWAATNQVEELQDEIDNPEIGKTRFGLRDYIHPKVRKALSDTSPEAATLELLDILWFGMSGRIGSSSPLLGTSGEIYQKVVGLGRSAAQRLLLAKLPGPTTFGRHLNKLAAVGHPRVKTIGKASGSRNRFRIPPESHGSSVDESGGGTMLKLAVGGAA